MWVNSTCGACPQSRSVSQRPTLPHEFWAVSVCSTSTCLPVSLSPSCSLDISSLLRQFCSVTPTLCDSSLYLPRALQLFFCVLIGTRLLPQLTVCVNWDCDVTTCTVTVCHICWRKTKFYTEAGNPPFTLLQTLPCLFHLLSLFAPLFYPFLRFFSSLNLVKSSLLSNRLLSGHASDPWVISPYAFYLNFYIWFCHHLLLYLPRSIYACCLWNW